MLYCAVIELAPSGSEEGVQVAVAFSLAALFVTDRLPQPEIADPPARNSTVPENASASFDVAVMVEVGATVAVRVTDCPSGAAVVADTVVVVPAAEIV